MQKIIRGIIGGIAVSLSLGGGAWVAAQEGSDTKQIRVTGSASKLEVEFTPTKAEYTVDEPIIFRITPKSGAYLYLFSLSDDQEPAVMLFPNDFESAGKIRANTEVTIPAKSVFKGDRPGVEKVVLVASTEKLNVPTAAKAAGATFAPVENNWLKAIRVESRQPASRLVKLIDVPIKAKAVPTASSQSSATPLQTRSQASVLIGTDKMAYQVQDPVRITYAATVKGYVALYAVDPQYQVSLLKAALPVEPGQTYDLRAEAIPPTGEHAVAAVFRKTDSTAGDETFVRGLLGRGQQKTTAQKGLRLVGEPVAYGVYRFTIQ